MLWDNWGDERDCDKGHWHAHIRGLPWGLREVVGTVQQVHCSWRKLLWREVEFHLHTINKSAHTKNLETYLMILLYTSVLSDELQNWPVCESFIVRRLVHRGNPTLSAWEVLIQWHGEPLRRETAKLQWMTRTSLGATSCSRHSKDICCHGFHNCWIFRWALTLVPPEVRWNLSIYLSR